jgi:TolB protein
MDWFPRDRRILLAIPAAIVLVAAGIAFAVTGSDDGTPLDSALAPTSSPVRSVTPSATAQVVPTAPVTETPSQGTPAECLPSSAPALGTPVPGLASGGLIAFLTDAELHVMRPDGSSKRRLAGTSAGPGPSSFQKWSPSGERIAFVGPDSSGLTGLYVVNADSSGLQRVTEANREGLEIAWSPDGSRLALSYLRFDSPGPGGTADIYIVNLDGTGRARITPGGGANTSPAWSPDGRRIAFVSDRDGNREIYVMNADGTAPTRLTNHPLEDDRPAWSPDGRLLLFVSNRDVDPQLRAASPSLYVPEIYVMNPDGSGQRNLSMNAEYDNFPVWSPSGDRIAFESDGDIFVMNEDGSGARQLTRYPCLDAGPSWSPDGRRIVFTRWFQEPASGEGTADIFVVGADGSGELRLTDGAGWEWLPAWSPR